MPGQLGADDSMRRDPTAVGVAELLQLAGLEAEGVPVQVFQKRSPGAGDLPDGVYPAISRALRSSEQPVNAANGPPASGSRPTGPAAVLHCGACSPPCPSPDTRLRAAQWASPWRSPSSSRVARADLLPTFG